MRVDEFDFTLPEDLIALRPVRPRDSARLLVVGPDGSLSHSHVSDLPNLLNSGDCLVYNDTKVFRARLHGVRPPRQAAKAGVPIELLLHQRLAADRFVAFARPARRLVPGDAIAFAGDLAATILARKEKGEVEIGFSRSGKELDQAIATIGEVPLPPYIGGRRSADAQDEVDYQTIYSQAEGSVAAPTAGLHFTHGLLNRLESVGIGSVPLTLHVGAGTFLPVSAEDTEQHKMHSEWASLSAEAAMRINAVRDSDNRLVAVGTTSLRTLETAAAFTGRVQEFHGATDIFIVPGHQFHTADVLLTNFHLPRSTLFMLVCAFHSRDVMQSAYREAIAHRYRFYSYGDACLIWRRS